MKPHRVFQAFLIFLLIGLVGDFFIQNFITPVSGSGFPTDTLKVIAELAVWLSSFITAFLYAVNEK